jgi:AcrR family transcriptional regulator
MARKKKSDPQSLPRGRHGLPREQVAENQRARLLGGMVEAVAERGYGPTTVADVTAAAKVSRRTFYEHFGDKEDCYRAAYEASFEFLRETSAAGAATARWPASLRTGLGALLDALAVRPELATFFLLSPSGVGDGIAVRHHEAIRELVEALLAEAPRRREATAAAEIRAAALAGGLSRLAGLKVAAGQAAELPALLPDLVELFLRPFVGSEEAIRLARDA